MRTTITLHPDVEAAIVQIRKRRGIGLSDAVNELVRLGLKSQKKTSQRFEQTTYSMKAKLDVTNVAEVLSLLDEK